MADFDWANAAQPAAGFDWANAATPAAAAKPKEKGITADDLKAGGRGALQGVTLGFGDEIQGLLAHAMQRGVNAIPESAKDVLRKRLGIDLVNADARDAYRSVRDADREANDAAEREHAGAYLTGNILGGVALPIPGGAAAQGAKYGAKVLRAAGQGGLMGLGYGLGSSRADLTKGDVGGMLADTALGGALGAAGGAIGEGVVAPAVGAVGKGLGRLGDALRGRANRGIAKAEEMATARATREGVEEVASLSGALGGETQKGSRMTENIRRIPGEAAEATPESQAALMQDAARMARERAEEMMNQAKAAGLEDVPETVGEFLTKGSKVDKAQKARAHAKRLLDGAAKLEGDAERVLAGELSPKAINANLKAARDIAMESPAFRRLEGTVLSENLRTLPGQVAKIEAARTTRDVAEAALPETIAKRSAELLSGKAASQRFKELALRYALPLSGAAAGAVFGDEYGGVGSLMGAGLGFGLGGKANAAIGSLAGAGLRPGFQALYRTATQYPAVQNAFWRGARALAPGAGGGPLRLLPRALPPATRTEALQSETSALVEALLRRRPVAERSDDVDPLATY